MIYFFKIVDGEGQPAYAYAGKCDGMANSIKNIAAYFIPAVPRDLTLPFIALEGRPSEYRSNGRFKGLYDTQSHFRYCARCHDATFEKITSRNWINPGRNGYCGRGQICYSRCYSCWRTLNRCGHGRPGRDGTWNSRQFSWCEITWYFGLDPVRHKHGRCA